MKSSVKKFFLLGMGLAAAGIAAGFAVKNKDKIKKAVDELVKKKKLLKQEGEMLAKELISEIEKVETKISAKTKKPVSKKKCC